MKLVVDANILFSFFRDNPVRFIILKSRSLNLELFSPSHVLDELNKNIPDLIKYTKLNSEQLESMVEELKKLITTVRSLEYKKFELEARKLSPHKSDKDMPYFALALKLNCPIWSNELSFKQQSKIKALSTKDMIELFA